MKTEQITPEQIKTWLTNSYNSANDIISILEDTYKDDENTRKMLLELKRHVKTLNFFY
ncbi:hypothetical protein ACIQZG_08450 [Lysinibacillus sp. NPDC096418]|uniref:hypothetical protein n=1 Tax=Lysinibacillus sp. NPDC096418 TaxID=3364138 RepID=UPI00380E5536